jgi:hypothetical protein
MRRIRRSGPDANVCLMTSELYHIQDLRGFSPEPSRDGQWQLRTEAPVTVVRRRRLGELLGEVRDLSYCSDRGLPHAKACGNCLEARCAAIPNQWKIMFVYRCPGGGQKLACLPA